MISLLDTTSDSSTVPANLSESAAPDSTVPFAIPVPETESAFATGNAESDTAAQRAMKEKRLFALQSVCLLDRDAKFRERVPEDLYYMISDRALSDRAGQDLLIGDEFARTVSNEDVYGALERYIEQASADKQPQMRERLRGCKTEADGKRLLGQLFRQEVQENYERDLKHQQEMDRKKEELGQALSQDLPTAIIEGRGLNPELMDQAQQFGNSEKILEAYQRARAAFDYLRTAQRGGHDEASYEDRVKKEYERLKESRATERAAFDLAMSTAGFPADDRPQLSTMPDDDMLQQARSNVGGSYEISRSSIVRLLDMLRDEQGRFDEQAWSALMLALDSDAAGQQTIDSRFLRNFVEALGRFGSQTADTFGRQVARSGMVALPNTFPAPLSQDEQERFRRLYAPEVEKIKGGLALIEDARLAPSDRASYVSGMLTESGSVAGESMPAVLANMILPGVGGVALSAAAMYPALSNEAVARNYFEGKRNAETLGLIQGAFQAGAEGLFGTATRSIPVVGRMMDRAALKMAGVPVVGKMLGAVQGNAMLRYAVDSVALESLGELVVEDVVAETGTYLTVEGARALGVDFDQYEWKPFQTAWQNFQDSRQVGATVAYCAALGLLGVRPRAAAARQFAQSQQAMLAAGLTEKSARQIARLEQQQRERVPELLERQESKLGRRLTEEEAREIVEPLEKELKETMQSAYEADVLDADPVQLARRLEKNHELYMSEAESQVALREGVLKAALREMGVLDTEPTITGKNLVTLEVPVRGSDSVEHKVVEWTDEQLAAYARYALGEVGLRRMREIRSAALAIDMAEQLNQQGKDYAKMLPISEAAAPVAVELAKSHGMMNLPVLRALAAAAKREGEAGVEVLPGVRNRVVASLADSFEQRLDVAEALGELSQSQAQDVRSGLNDAVGAAAVRLPAAQGPASRILYNPGHTMSVGIAEDAVEAMLTARLRRDGGIDDDGRVTPTGRRWLENMMAEMRRVNELVRASTGAELMPGLDSASPDLQTVTEYFSHLVQSDFYRRAGHYGLSDEAQKHVSFMDAALMQGRYLDLIDRGFSQWVRSEEGRAWESAGGTLAGLLNEAGLELGSLYNSSRVRAEAVAAVEEARAYMRDPSAGGKVSLADLEQTLELAGQEQQERDQPSLAEHDVPAEDSVTGEAIPDDGGESSAAYTADGQLVAPLGTEVLQEPLERGAGLVDGAFAAMADGSVMGVARVEDIGLCPDVPQFKTKKAAAGRERASEDGTTHELSGGFRKDSPPITVWRRKNGALQVITGRHRLAHAKKNGEAFISVRVYDEDATHDASWAKLYDVEMNILDRQAGAQDVAYFFRNSRMTLQEAESRGLMPRRKDGEQTATGTIGIAVALQACDEVYTRFINGALSERNAYFIATLGVDAPAQELAAKLLSGSKPKSLEYVRAYVTAAEEQRAASDEPAMFDLFGHDESWAQEADKLARYVEAVRKHLSAQLSILQSGSSLKRKGEAAGKLGISIKTPQDLTRLLSEMVVLDAALERMDPELGLGRLAAEWDGSGTPDVEGSGLMNYAANLVVGMKSAPSFSLADMRKTRVRLSAKDVSEMSAMPNLRMDVDNLDQVYEMAKAGMDDIRNAIESVGRDLGLIVKMRNSLKGRERAAFKVKDDYKGDAGKLLDVYGGTIVLQPGDSFTDVIEAVKERGLDVVRVKSGYAHESKYGYADVKLNLRTRHGFIGELILIEQHMMEVKGEVGHLIYEVSRKIDPAIKDERDSVKKARLKTLQEALAQYSQGLYQGADYNDMKELRERALDACQEAQSTLKGYVSAELPELGTVLGKLQQGEEYYRTRAQNSFSVTSKKSYGRLSYDRQTGNDQSSYLVPSSDFSSRYQLPHRSFPQTLSVSRSSIYQQKSILETASRNSSRVSYDVNIDNSPVSQGEEKSKNNFAKSASSAEEVEGILPLRTWEGWLQFEPDENAAGGVAEIVRAAGREPQRMEGMSFSVETKEVAECISELCTLDKEGKPAKSAYLRNTEWGKDILVEWGKKTPKGEYKSGVNHIVDRRMTQGLTLDETAFVFVCALDAAQSVQPQELKNKRLFERFGVRAVVAENSPTERPLITGFIITPKHKKGAGETAAPNAGTQPYALNELARTQEVVAALSSAVSRFDSIVKQNPADWEKIIENEIEMLRIKQESIFEAVFMKAPNGKPTNLTERQWLTVRTQAFKNWFGDWENDPEAASKVVDENGEPKVVYHNSGKRRNVLSREFSRKSMDIESVCFAPESDPYGEYGPYEHAVFLRILTPADYDTAYTEHGIKLAVTDDAGVKIREWLQNRGYDGVIEEEDGAPFEYKVFESTQIKSATDNRGTFDPAAPDITFSLMAGSGESYSLSVGGAARAALEPFGKEAMLERMARNIEKAEQTWKQAFAGRDPMESRDVAAEQMGQLMALAMGVHRSLPEGYRARLDALLRRGNVLARMLESGRLRSYGKMNKAQRAELVAEVERGMLEEFPGLEAVGEGSGRKARAEALKAAREEVSRHVAERGLSELVVEMTEEAAGQMRRYLRDQEVRRIAALVDRFTPRVGKNGKMEKGKLEASLYRRLAEIVQMMQASADVRDAQIAALQGRIAEAEAAGDTGLCDELTAKQMEWSTFGAIKSQSLESVRKARAELLSMLGNGQARWQFKLNREKARVDYIVKEALNAMGEADDARLAKQKSRAEKMSMWQKLRALPAYAQSIGQLLYGLAGIPGIERLADESSRAITDGHMALAARENELSRAMAAKLEELGFASNAQKADFMKSLKETVDTGIVPQKERERHRVKLEVEEARRWAAMSFEERAEERNRIREGEKESRLKAQNVPLESDMPLLRAELSKVDASSRARRWVTIDREIEIDVKREPLRISRDQALNLILLCEQPRYKNGSAAAHGYTDEVLAKLRDFVGAKGMAFGYWMRDYLSRTGLQEVFESREGVPFPAEENYWPAAFDQSGKINENVNALDPATGQYSTRYSMLITRVNHKLSFDLTIGATNTFMGAMAMQNNYICMGSLTQLWRRLLSHQRFARSLRQRIGESRFKAIKEGVNLLDGQGVAEAYAQKQLSGIIGMFQGAHAPAVLAGSVTTLIKQISAIMHGASYPGINPFRLISQMLIDRLGGGRMTYKRMMDESVFRERVGTREVWEEMARLGPDVTWSRLAAWSRAGMRFLEKSDVAANCASMTALYNVLWAKFQADNRSGAVKMSEEEMHRRCMQAVERTMDLSAQPMRRSQKALAQAVNQGIFNRLSFYMASEVMNKIGMVLAAYQRGGGGRKGFFGAWKFLATMSVMEQLMCMAIDLIRGNGPDVDEDDTWAMWIACNLATGFLGVGLLSGVPILGSMVSHLSGGYVKTNAFADALGADVLSNGKKIWRMASGKKEYSPAEWALQIFNASRAVVGGLGSFAGGVYSGAQFVSSATGLLQSANAAFNVVRPFVPWFKTGKDEVRGSRGR